VADIQKKEPDHLKEAKKLFDSYSEVLKHKLGRNPTWDEIVSEIKEQKIQPSPANPTQGVETLAKEPSAPAPTGVPAVAPAMEKAADKQAPATMAPPEGTPKIFRLQILYGLKDDGSGNKQPDPATPLFYTDGQRHFDCSTDQWTDQVPEVAQHLMSRPLQHSAENTDLFDALLHGVVDDDDFNALDQAGMVDDRSRKLRELMGNLDSQYGEYSKLTSGMEPVEKTDVYDHLHTSEDSSADPVQDLPQAYEGREDMQEPINTPQLPTNALADALSGAFGPGVDPRTVEALKRMIRDEVLAILNEGLPK
jgi:hypothetical protein